MRRMFEMTRWRTIKSAAVLLTAAVLVGGPASSALAGAWTMEKGHMYNKLAVNYFTSSHTYEAGGNRRSLKNGGRFRDINFNWYEEYGLTGRLTAISSVYYKWLSYDDDNPGSSLRSNAAGDIDLGFKLNLLKNPLVFSCQALVKVEGPYDREDRPEPGNKQNDYELRLLLGKSLYPQPLYLGLEAGYRWRCEDPSDEWRFLAEFGGDFSKRLYGRIKLDVLLSADNANKTQDTVTNIAITPEYDITKLDLTLGLRLNGGWGAEISYVPTISGKNTAAGYTLTTALIYCF